MLASNPSCSSFLVLDILSLKYQTVQEVSALPVSAAKLNIVPLLIQWIPSKAFQACLHDSKVIWKDAQVKSEYIPICPEKNAPWASYIYINMLIFLIFSWLESHAIVQSGAGLPEGSPEGQNIYIDWFVLSIKHVQFTVAILYWRLATGAGCCHSTPLWWLYTLIVLDIPTWIGGSTFFGSKSLYIKAIKGK